MKYKYKNIFCFFCFCAKKAEFFFVFCKKWKYKEYDNHNSDQHSNNDNGLSISDIFQASGCGEIIEEFEQNNEITNLFETSSTENEPPELEEPVSD